MKGKITFGKKYIPYPQASESGRLGRRWSHVRGPLPSVSGKVLVSGGRAQPLLKHLEAVGPVRGAP